LDLVDLLSESNTLVITDRHLIPEEFYEFGKGRYNPLYGCAEGANAYITTLPFHGRGVERFVRRVSVLALHEVGHLNGLEHQYGLSDHLQELRDGSFCPMVTPDMLFTSLGRGYRGVNAYDCRSTGFCPDCDKRLG
ncbi:hypothetical protein KY362_00495, partial [Candidatus Woesearchaeota archaeon]|nr:hypothetical protein [Candidatus Woesearchaeota archaeon]